MTDPSDLDSDLPAAFEDAPVPVAAAPLTAQGVHRAAPVARTLDAVAQPVDELRAILDAFLPEEAVAAIHRFRFAILGIVVVGVLTELLPQAPWLLIVPSLVAIGGLRLDRRLRFGFAEGFIGPRTELGWPRGVQEDDDIRWTWKRGVVRVR